MKKIINYEKDIIFKTRIGEICSISLENEFNVEGDYLKGEFIISGEYKSNELSVNKEEFEYKLPLEYELEKNVQKESIVYEIENFEYTISADTLSIFIDLGIRYDEVKIEPIIPEVIDDIPLPKLEPEEKEEPIREEVETEVIKEENNIVNNIESEDKYVTYHIHVVKDGDTIENISNMYNTNIDLIKEYNDEDITVGTRLIVPEINE